jgi:hypothetical protein
MLRELNSLIKSAGLEFSWLSILSVCTLASFLIQWVVRPPATYLLRCIPGDHSTFCVEELLLHPGQGFLINSIGKWSWPTRLKIFYPSSPTKQCATTDNTGNQLYGRPVPIRQISDLTKQRKPHLPSSSLRKRSRFHKVRNRTEIRKHTGLSFTGP